MITLEKKIEGLSLCYSLADKCSFKSNLNEDSSLEDLHMEVLEFLYDEIDEKDYILLEPEESSSSDVIFILPLAGQICVTGEFAYDKKEDLLSYVSQDLDGKMYLIKW